MDTIESNGKSDPVLDISPDGDVVLVVGPRNERLRVQSQCLQCASKVFDAMFKPYWSEGQGLSKESPREVPLVEDDAHAMQTICCVIHHRNNDVPVSLTSKEVLQIAIAVDKYDLKVALKYASVQWLKPRPDEERVDKGYLLAAAFLYDDMDTFAAHTLSLILYHKGSYLEFLDDEITNQIVHWKTFYLLKERRTRMRAELSQLLIKGKRAACSCGWAKTRGEKYALLLLDYGPLKMLDAPISEIIEKMEKVSCEDMGRKYHGNWLHEAPTKDETLPGQLETLKKKVSIYLDCVRSLDATIPCRFQHE
ncbi:uncharacterized protein PAC_10001 [Phialocephala subalpina]|uniref:BTB domain-containing protein n=1 Tax=Phialocephala subalpina TaxID=576137 RepID=A0A1L7X515_9HELO|nr:uncharacterized protein PAC_10001 [Phialocephala subalpina]